MRGRERGGENGVGGRREKRGAERGQSEPVGGSEGAHVCEREWNKAEVS